MGLFSRLSRDPRPSEGAAHELKGAALECLQHDSDQGSVATHIAAIHFPGEPAANLQPAQRAHSQGIFYDVSLDAASYKRSPSFTEGETLTPRIPVPDLLPWRDQTKAQAWHSPGKAAPSPPPAARGPALPSDYPWGEGPLPDEPAPAQRSAQVSCPCSRCCRPAHHQPNRECWY